MSASPMARQLTESKAIPTKRVVVNDPSDMPQEYSSTPGGTLYSTTPGGSRIVYERSFLIKLSESPISKTPPSDFIPKNIQRRSNEHPPGHQHHQRYFNDNKAQKIQRSNCKKPVNVIATGGGHHPVDDDEQFQMDM